jgi:hypothetical protein
MRNIQLATYGLHICAKDENVAVIANGGGTSVIVGKYKRIRVRIVYVEG